MAHIADCHGHGHGHGQFVWMNKFNGPASNLAIFFVVINENILRNSLASFGSDSQILPDLF
jgi:hypothetical protein